MHYKPSLYLAFMEAQEELSLMIEVNVHCYAFECSTFDNPGTPAPAQHESLKSAEWSRVSSPWHQAGFFPCQRRETRE
jgi:hypothetical protein